MENHPIPQDVTGFKFKLIGSMTVKQFLYLLGFGIIATICFVLNINFLIRIPLVIFFSLIGCALAFVPIDGRPMDVMIANFAKTIPSENRYIFKKRGVDISSHIVFKSSPKPTQAINPTAPNYKVPQEKQNSDKRAQLISRLRNSSFRPDTTEVKSLNNIHELFENSSKPIVSIAPIATPVVAPIQDHKDMEEQMQKLDEQIRAENRQKETASNMPPIPEPVVQSSPVAPTTQIKLAGSEAPHEIPSELTAPKAVGQNPNPTRSAGFPTLPDIGNVIMGMICDPRKKSLPNILVEVMDPNGIPVRTFKTNALGQFAAATPLPNGAYKIHFEDAAKQHEFADVNINLAGEIFQPLEITSVDAREKLRQELFGGMGGAVAAA